MFYWPLFLVLFTIVETKIAHYSSLAYFAVSYLAAFAIYKTKNNREKFRNYVKYGTLIIGMLLVALNVVMPILLKDNTYLVSMFEIKDKFALANLQAEAGWGINQSLLAVVLFVGLTLYLIINRFNYQLAIFVLMLANGLYCFWTIKSVVPRIEHHTQRAAIEFYKSKADEDCYLKTMGFKSYAHYFYGNIRPEESNLAIDISLVEQGALDKPVYFICKKNKKERILLDFPFLQTIYEKNGFVFMQRADTLPQVDSVTTMEAQKHTNF
ncbi:MAG: hypothetical protein HC896_06700 [Bacteroidales bacterium]|nr:hypothetical protein [Bacteroidales bacterium]